MDYVSRFFRLFSWVFFLYDKAANGAFNCYFSWYYRHHTSLSYDPKRCYMKWKGYGLIVMGLVFGVALYLFNHAIMGTAIAVFFILSGLWYWFWGIAGNII